MRTPVILETSAKDSIFSMNGSFICTAIVKSSSSLILLKDRCFPFVKINSFSSALQFREFSPKMNF